MMRFCRLKDESKCEQIKNGTLSHDSFRQEIHRDSFGDSFCDSRPVHLLVISQNSNAIAQHVTER